MAEQKPQERGFGKGRGGAKGGKQGPRGKPEKAEWEPLTKLGRLVKAGKIDSIDYIFKLSIPIKEIEIVDQLFMDKEPGDKLKEEVMQLKPVQKQTQAGQRMRFKAYVAIGDSTGHIGLGWKSHKEVQGAIKGAVINAKQNIIPVRKGYWGNMIGNSHTVPFKMSGKCGSVRVRLIPAPRGTGLVASPVAKKVLQLAGVGDCFTCSSGSTKTRGNFSKAIFHALKRTYSFLTPDWWGRPEHIEHPYETHSQSLSKGMKK